MGLYDDKYFKYVSNELHRLICRDLDIVFECDGKDYMYWPDDEDEQWDRLTQN